MCCIIGTDPCCSAGLGFHSPTGSRSGVSIRCALLAVPPGSDAVCVTQTAAADFQTDQKGLALLREGLNVRGAWSSQADSVALQSQVSVCLRHVN